MYTIYTRYLQFFNKFARNKNTHFLFLLTFCLVAFRSIKSNAKISDGKFKFEMEKISLFGYNEAHLQKFTMNISICNVYCLQFLSSKT